MMARIMLTFDLAPIPDEVLSRGRVSELKNVLLGVPGTYDS
jgi:hypothetical protein